MHICVLAHAWHSQHRFACCLKTIRRRLPKVVCFRPSPLPSTHSGCMFFLQFVWLPSIYRLLVCPTPKLLVPPTYICNEETTMSLLSLVLVVIPSLMDHLLPVHPLIHWFIIITILDRQYCQSGQRNLLYSEDTDRETSWCRDQLSWDVTI